MSIWHVAGCGVRLKDKFNQNENSLISYSSPHWRKVGWSFSVHKTFLASCMSPEALWSKIDLKRLYSKPRCVILWILKFSVWISSPKLHRDAFTWSFHGDNSAFNRTKIKHGTSDFISAPSTENVQHGGCFLGGHQTHEISSSLSCLL